MQVTASTGTVFPGSTLQMSAQQQNGKTTTNVTNHASWSSSNSQVATVSATGLVSALKAGSVAITAKTTLTSGSMSLTVTTPPATGLILSQQGSSPPVGTTQQFTASATYSDGTTGDVTSSVQWAVTPSSVATIDAQGVLTALSTGPFTVTVQSGSITATVVAAVPSMVQVSPSLANLALGTTQQLKAMAPSPMVLCVT
jgi:uncharacterized protein YjdB